MDYIPITTPTRQIGRNSKARYRTYCSNSNRYIESGFLPSSLTSIGLVHPNQFSNWFGFLLNLVWHVKWLILDMTLNRGSGQTSITAENILSERLQENPNIVAESAPSGTAVSCMDFLKNYLQIADFSNTTGNHHG